MDYKETISYLRQTHKFGTKLGLESTEELLRRLGDPQKQFKSIHVAGTNGKGSVTAMLTNILQTAGYKTGMFVSPSLERFTERVQVNLKEITEFDVARLISKVRIVIDEMLSEGYDHPTEFEIVTALGFLYFAENKVDYTVVEVGLGGRLDSTNVILPVLSIITSIGFDHMEVLGDTLGKIAFEKAGIIKKNIPTVLYPQENEALEVIEAVAKLKSSTLYRVNPQMISINKTKLGKQSFDYRFGNLEFKDIVINLSGRHQMLNAATVLTAVLALRKQNVNVTDNSIYEGLCSVFWPGRLELLSLRPDILLDGAHNLQGMNALCDTLKEYFCDRKKVLVIGILEDKEYEKMLQNICELFDTVVTTKPDSPRAISAEKLSIVANKYCENVLYNEDPKAAIAMARDLAGSEDLLVITGSLYLIGAVRHILLNS